MDTFFLFKNLGILKKLCVFVNHAKPVKLIGKIVLHDITLLPIKFGLEPHSSMVITVIRKKLKITVFLFGGVEKLYYISSVKLKLNIMLFQEIIFGLNIIQLGIIVLLCIVLFKKFPIFVSGVILCIVGLTFLGVVAIFISLVLGVFGMFGSVLGLGKRKTSKSRR